MIENHPNIGTFYKSTVDKKNILKGSLVKVISRGENNKITCEFNKYMAEYDITTELQDLGVIVSVGLYYDHLIEIIETIKDDKWYGAYVHLTKNVRKAYDQYKLFNDFLYAGRGNDNGIENRYTAFNYHYKELTDEEISRIILDEIIYGLEPDLQSTSMVGYTQKGIDKDGNYHNGHYFLPNNVEYTVTWCCGKIIIREGLDGGWYKGKNVVGRTVFEGNLDYVRYKEALIQKDIKLKMLQNPDKFLKEIPEIKSLIYNHIKDSDKYKLNSEFSA
jgi:hypothetical protein